MTEATALPGAGAVRAISVATRKHRGSQCLSTNARSQRPVAANAARRRAARPIVGSSEVMQARNLGKQQRAGHRRGWQQGSAGTAALVPASGRAQGHTTRSTQLQQMQCLQRDCYISVGMPCCERSRKRYEYEAEDGRRHHAEQAGSVGCAKLHRLSGLHAGCHLFCRGFTPIIHLRMHSTTTAVSRWTRPIHAPRDARLA